MAITPIDLLLTSLRPREPDPLSTLTGPAVLGALAGANRAELVGFAQQLGQALAVAGTLGLDTTSLTRPADDLNPRSPLDLFDTTLRDTLGLTSLATQARLAQLLVGDLGLGDRLTDALFPTRPAEPEGVFFRQGEDGTLFVQVRFGLFGFDINLDPAVFASSVVAQRFAIGNATGTPA